MIAKYTCMYADICIHICVCLCLCWFRCHDLPIPIYIGLVTCDGVRVCVSLYMLVLLLWWTHVCIDRYKYVYIVGMNNLP